MRVVYNQSWTDVIYGKSKLYGGSYDLRFWSNIVQGKGDDELEPSTSSMLGLINWIIKHLKWKKYVIIVPEGEPETKFRIGFSNEMFKICKLSSVTRRVSDGPFAMRMGPEDCHFFVVADNQKIKIKIAGYIRKDLWLY